MINFNGGSVALGTTLSPLGVYAGYLLMHSGNIWIATGFLVLAGAYFLLVVATLCRYFINYKRSREVIQTAVLIQKA